ncbi:MAG TPA: PQ-loop repeat-containing protein [Anaeromyxobacteraceae bacterium]|nr:PQ-loop repeat-containing protein [Anaeromyxobacteraceae bacterium]
MTPLTTHVAQALGFIGTLMVAIGYLPQIVHIAREGCSAGISANAWGLWLLASVLIFTHALAVADLVFIVLQSVNILAIVAVIVLARRYRYTVCRTHERPVEAR